MVTFCRMSPKEIIIGVFVVHNESIKPPDCGRCCHSELESRSGERYQSCKASTSTAIKLCHYLPSQVFQALLEYTLSPLALAVLNGEKGPVR